ncbi:MAG: hypothetical protein M3R17_10530 [Bacteroidota bacterium]|nr:hypothetical protein [Bacteroidota bacterium]
MRQGGYFYLFKSRIDDYILNHPSLDNTALQNLENLITQTDSWDFLSQSLDGFMQQLALRDVQSNVVPGDPVMNGLIGDNNSIVTLPGAGPVPFEGWQPSNFQQYRSGQFAFNWVVLVDRFGQTMEVVNENAALQYTPVKALDMKPVNTVLANDPYTFVELKPRLLQPGRLHFDFVSALNNTQLILTGSTENPVCAWVLTNHIDRSLACYDNTGLMLGELSVITNASGNAQVNWAGAPSAQFSSLTLVNAAYPHLGEMLNGLVTAGASAFQNFYESIDATMWSIDPMGNRDDQNLSVLIGRPLALVRCRLMYDLQGPPISDPSWLYTFSPAASEVVTYNFPVRLGDLALRTDGLIGYFNGTNYAEFNSVYIPAGIVPVNPPYPELIAPGNFVELQINEQSTAFITMLMDPRASVNATTSILPVETVTIPARFVDPVIAAMAVTFNVGPLLSNLSTSANRNSESIIMPIPAEKNGRWEWLTPVSQQVYSLQASDGLARFRGMRRFCVRGYCS